ncbi:MAG: 7-carboxy-7-deazaguanine synthase QueE [Nitrospinota bacterium]
MSGDYLNVSEIFCSIQGESSYAGRRSAFIRLFGCNILCSWCDTVYALKGDKQKQLSHQAIIDQISTYNLNLVELTGGEPLIQDGVDRFISKLIDLNWELLIETNGTIDLRNFDSRPIYIVDYKLASAKSEVPFFKPNFANLKSNDELKFVIGSKSDFLEATKVIKEEELEDRVVVNFSPITEMIKPLELANLILEAKLNVRLNLQLHKILWPNIPSGV